MDVLVFSLPLTTGASLWKVLLFVDMRVPLSAEGGFSRARNEI